VEAGKPVSEDVGGELVESGDEGPEVGLYGFLLDGDGQELYGLAGEPGVSDEIRLVRMKIGLAVKAGNDPELREWLDLFVRLRNVEARLGGRRSMTTTISRGWRWGAAPALMGLTRWDQRVRDRVLV
jgi:hypothetical protein